MRIAAMAPSSEFTAGTLSETRASSPLLEREAEVAALKAVVDAVRGGDGHLVAIEGRAGIGKTRLLAEARSAAAAGLEVLTARGSELEEDFAYGIVRQLFEPLLASGPEELRARLLAGAAGLAAPLFDERELAAAFEGTTGSSFATLHGLYWLAANLAADRPTLLAIDDLHWADAPSLRWLLYLMHRLEGVPLLVLATLRPPEQSRQGSLLTELVSDAETILLRLTALGRESVVTLAREVFAAEPDERFCSVCHDATGGNPLFLRALLATLAAEGFSPNEKALARVREVGPEPVARAVSLRLSRLPQEASALARAVAILGDGAELRHAAALAGLAPDVAIPIATALARADLLRLEPRLEFTHPIVRTVVYEEIGAAERVGVHRQAAALLAEAGAEPERAAAHLLLVPPEGNPLVPSVLREAARRAVARGAAEATVAYLRRALVEPPSESERVEILCELGVAERSVDLAAAPEHLSEAIDLIDDPALHAQLALEHGRALYFAGRDGEAIDVMRQAVDQLGGVRPDLREQLDAELVSVAWYQPEHHPFARELLAAVSDQGLAGGFGTDMLLAALAYHETRLGADRARAVALAERSLASGSLEREATFALYQAPDALVRAGHLESARAAYDRAVALARRRGDLVNVAGLLGFRGMLATEQGDLQSAEPDLREGVELSEQAGSPSNFNAIFLADFLLERGDFEEAEAVVARLGLGEEVPASAHFIFFLDTRGKLRLAQRLPDKALSDFLASGRIAEAIELRNPAFRPWRSHAAEALQVLGRHEEAQELASEELELARRWGAPRTIGISLRALALIQDWPAGERPLREAVDVLAASPARLEHAKALVDLGAALRRSNQRSEARKLLREGLELAHRCGARPLVERANDELAATGAHRRTILLSGLDSLTASERRVAQMAADDLSNKEIAQALFVTVKTVEVHLSRVYRKLDISSRRQLARALGAPAEAVAENA
jgi:DNA-binding CsgD family transcriptional regulator